MCDRSLTRHVDNQGRQWVICQLCVEWTSYEQLAVDPDDGIRWDICKTCDKKESNESKEPGQWKRNA